MSTLRRSNPAASKRWYEKLTPAQREQRHRTATYRQYGLTPSEYDAMLSAQRGVCAICLSPCKTGRRLAVDHCHITNKVRGLLCVNCNQALGKMDDSPAVLRAAANYLERAAAK